MSSDTDQLPLPALSERVRAARALAEGPRLDYDRRRQALGELADRMLRRDGDTARLASVDGFAFLAAFLRPDHLDRLLQGELPVAALRGFVPSGERRELRLVPKGVACHWVAGNVPMLGMFSWALSALVGNVNIVRLSSRQDDLLSPLLRTLAGVSEDGLRMASETTVLRFDRDDITAHQQMSAAADVRIAWGGSEAVETILSLPCSWDCETIVLGPRVSMAVIDPAAVSPKSLTLLATDIAYFDQQACSSPQFVFVRRRDDGRFDETVRALATALDVQARRYPRHALDFGETYRIALDRSRVALSGGQLRTDTGTQWTVATVERPVPDVRCVNRFVQVVPYDHLAAVLPLIPRNVQSVIVSLDAADEVEFTDAAALRGVCRFPRPGQGNFFESPWDGVPIASRLVRWVTRTARRQSSADGI